MLDHVKAATGAELSAHAATGGLDPTGPPDSTTLDPTGRRRQTAQERNSCLTA